MTGQETKKALDVITIGRSSVDLYGAQIGGRLEVTAIFYLRCKHEEVLVERLQRRALKENRLDDANLDVICKRLKTYELESKPVLACYEKKLLHRIDAGQDPVKVLFDILRHAVKS